MEGKQWFYADRAVEANYSDLSFQVDLPCQKITRTLVRPRGGFVISGIALLLPKESRRIPILDSELPVYRPLCDPEILIIPYITPGDGIDLSRSQPGDMQLAFSIDSYREGERNRLILWHEVAVER